MKIGISINTVPAAKNRLTQLRLRKNAFPQFVVESQCFVIIQDDIMRGAGCL